jgi:hypothetical protein
MLKSLDMKLYELFEKYEIPVKIKVTKNTWTITKIGEINHKKNFNMICKEYNRIIK